MLAPHGVALGLCGPLRMCHADSQRKNLGEHGAGPQGGLRSHHPGRALQSAAQALLAPGGLSCGIPDPQAFVSHPSFEPTLGGHARGAGGVGAVQRGLPRVRRIENDRAARQCDASVA